MTYDDALRALNSAAYAAAKAARDEGKATADDLKNIARDTDYLVDHGMTFADFQVAHRARMEAAK